MRSSFFITLALTFLIGGGYVYYVAGSVCPVPLAYHLGSLDERFDISEEEAKLAVSQAESIWEDATGRNLFTYGDGGDLTVNFIFDERQALSDKETLFKEKLDETETVSDSMKNTYATLVNQYNNLRIEHAKQVETYEKNLDAYNLEVEKYNARGGAPSDVFQRLEEEKRQLNTEQSNLNRQSAKLNALVTEINAVGEKANRIVNTYNQGVDTYNQAFGTAREFTQGDYTQNTINIYTFDTRAELVLVLVHEMGHALSLEHVENADSAMHYLLKNESTTSQFSEDDIVLSVEDVAEFERVCGQKNVLEKMRIALSRY